MLRLAKNTVMLARRADPSLGEGRAFQKISESFGPQLTSFQAHYPRNQSINTEVSVEENTLGVTLGEPREKDLERRRPRNYSAATFRQL
jgi:hypothetical protein